MGHAVNEIFGVGGDFGLGGDGVPGDGNVVERSFNDHKQWRGLATRYDNFATNYRGAVMLRAITLWLRE